MDCRQCQANDTSPAQGDGEAFASRMARSYDCLDRHASCDDYEYAWLVITPLKIGDMFRPQPAGGVST